MTLNHLLAWLNNAGALGNAEYAFIAIAPWSTLSRVVAPDRVLSMGQIELFDIQTVSKQMTYLKSSCQK